MGFSEYTENTPSILGVGFKLHLYDGIYADLGINRLPFSMNFEEDSKKVSFTVTSFLIGLSTKAHFTKAFYITPGVNLGISSLYYKHNDLDPLYEGNHYNKGLSLFDISLHPGYNWRKTGISLGFKVIYLDVDSPLNELSIHRYLNRIPYVMIGFNYRIEDFSIFKMKDAQEEGEVNPPIETKGDDTNLFDLLRSRKTKK